MLKFGIHGGYVVINPGAYMRPAIIQNIHVSFIISLIKLTQIAHHAKSN